MRSLGTLAVLATLWIAVGRSLDAEEPAHHTFRYLSPSGSPESFRTMAFSPDSRQLAISVARRVEFISPDRGDVIWLFKASPFTISYSKDGRRVYMISEKRDDLLNALTREELETSYEVTAGLPGVTLHKKNGKLLIKQVHGEGPAADLDAIEQGDELIGAAEGRNGEMRSLVGKSVKEANERLGGPAGTYLKLQISPKGRPGPQNAEIHLLRRHPVTVRDKKIYYENLHPLTLDENLAWCMTKKRHEFRSAASGAPLVHLQTIDIRNDRGPRAISPNQKLFAMASNLKADRETLAVEVFDISTQDRIVIMRLPKNSASAMAFAPDNNRLLVASWDSVEIADVEKKRFTGRIDLGWKQLAKNRNRARPNATDITSTTRDTLADGSGTFQDPDRRAPEQLGAKLAVSSKDIVATADNSGRVKLWDLNTRELLKELHRNSRNEAQGIAFSPDSKWLAYHLEGILHIVDVSSVEPVSNEEIALRRKAAAGSRRPTEPQIRPQQVSGRLKQVIMTRTRLEEDDGDGRPFLAFSPEGDRLYIGSPQIGPIPSNPVTEDRKPVPFDVPVVMGGKVSTIFGQEERLSNAIAVHNVSTGEQLQVYQPEYPGQPNNWEHCVFGTLSHDGKYLAFFIRGVNDLDGAPGELCVYDTTTGRQKFRVSPDDQLVQEDWAETPAFKVAFLQDSAQLLTEIDGELRKYDSFTGRLIDRVNLNAADGVDGMSGRIVTARNKPVFAFGTSIWNWQTQQLVSPSVEVYGQRAIQHQVVAISANGQLLLGGGGYAKVFCVYEGKYHRIDPLKDNPDAMALSDDARLLAASVGKQIFVMALLDSQGRLNARLLGTIDGHLQVVDGLALSRDGKLLASTSLDGSTRIWDIADLRK